MALQINKSLNNIVSFIGPSAAMKASLLISFIFHITLLLFFQNVLPFYPNTAELKTYTVDIIRPPIEDIDTGESPEDLIDDIKENESPITDSYQDTISLDTKDKRYASYVSLIKKEILTCWRYPVDALANLIEGNLTVIFSLSSDGKMTSISIIKASGYEILDQEVIRAINSAAPFPPFPESITVKRLNIKASFDYRLTSEK